MKTTIRNLLMLAAVLSVSANAFAYDFEADGIYYNILSEDDKTVEVTLRGYKNGFPDTNYSGDVVIPERVQYNDVSYSVTSIGSNVFYYCRGLTSVTIPNSVTSIGGLAFYNCSGLKSVTIPNSVTTIGDDAFYYCISLESVNISNLSAWCKIDFGNSYSNPLEYAHNHNLYLNGALVTDLVIPEDISEIKSYAFSGGACITSVTIHNSVTSIGNSAFSGCSSLTSVIIPNSVTSIGSSAFYGCSSLTSVTIPNSVTTIGDDAFSFCSSLESVNISNLSAWCKIDFGNSYSNPLEYAHNLYLNGALVTDLVIPEDISEIKSYAFSGGACITSVTIPNSVTTIGGSAFYGCSSLTSVTIGNGVTSIGDSAFYGCSSLTSVTIGNGVTSIGDSAFYGCSSLASVNISNLSAWCRINFEDNGSNPLVYAHNLYLNGALVTDLVIPEDISEIKSYAFSGGNYITSVTIPNSVTSIGNYSFDDCRSLKYLTIEGGGEILSLGYNYDSRSYSKDGEGLFHDCPLETVYLGRNLSYLSDREYGYSPFYNTPIKELTIGDSVTSIGYSAFNGCSSLISVKIGSGILSIGTDAFSYTNLKKVVWLPNTPPAGYNNVSSERNYVANDSYSELKNVTVYPYLSSMFEVGGLKYVPVSPSERTCDAIDCSYDDTAANIVIGKTVSYQGIEMTLLDVKDYVCYVNDSIKTLQIKEYTGNIGIESFYDCGSLGTVNISNMIGSIGDNTFYDCSNVKTVDIQNLEGNIGESSFYSCGNLETVNINDMKGNIGSKVFYDCTNIKAVDIQNLEGNIGGSSFNGCSNIETVDIRDMVGSIGYRAFYGCDNLKTVDIQNLEGNIGGSSFYGCSNLETVNISDMRGNIGDEAFYDCENLKGIEIPNTVTGIGVTCFSGCSSLEYATIGSGISTLPKSCFSGCSSLPEIIIPSTVGSIGNNAFYGCSALTRIDIADRQTELVLGYNSEYSNSDQKPLFSDCPLDSVYIGGNISYGTGSGSGYSPFYRNTSLRAVKITDQETEISENEFYGCTGLKRVELGDGIESIGNYAFSGCSALESFTFGNSLATIGNEAFSDCTAMTRLVSKTEVPPVCGSQALDDINKWTCELFVPQKSLEAYKAAEQWKEFFFIKGDDSGESSGIGNVASKEEISVISRNGYIEITGVENQEVEVYNLSGQLVYGGTETVINMPAKGIYIVHVSGLTFKVIL